MSEDKSADKTNISPLHPLAKFVWEQEGEKREQVVSSTGLTIGRSSENDLVVSEVEASRFHCKVMPATEGFIVVDLDSSNGTFVNSERVEDSRTFVDGDTLRVGQQDFKFVTLAPEMAVEEAPAEEELSPFEQTYVVPPTTNFPRLVISSGVGKGTEYTLTVDRMQVGRASRDQQWEVDLVDRAVSRPHAELVRQGEEWVVTDLGSANGTTVNGERISEPCALQEGDIVGFGETLLVFRTPQGT
jgi:pSer/pThr/pTyr-binding forkhead associated (FHA) protein